jgi:DNA-binding LacI/PurR family transcriptional regulator
MVAGGHQSMITITFPDRDTEKRALAFLLGRFSGRVLRTGEHLVPEAALEALADQNIPFTVVGKTTYEQQMAAIRSAASP